MTTAPQQIAFYADVVRRIGHGVRQTYAPVTPHSEPIHRPTGTEPARRLWARELLASPESLLRSTSHH